MENEDICENCKMKHYDSPKGKNKGISFGWINNRCSDFVQKTKEVGNNE